MQTIDPTTNLRLIRDEHAREIERVALERRARAGRPAATLTVGLGRIAVALRALTAAHA